VPYLKNCSVVYTCESSGAQDAVHPVANGTVVWSGSTIDWVGPFNKLPAQFSADQAIDCRGGMAIPGLIDCHTHLAFGGWRENECTARIKGQSYADIANAGGGILSTVRDTRSQSQEQLVTRCFQHLNQISKLGVTTIEVKSGYGLDRATELRLLETYRDLAKTSPLTIVPTFLGAHVVPTEFTDKRSDYISLLCEELIPEIAERKLANFCDVFVEQGAFTVAEARQILITAQRYGLAPKLHIDQFHDLGAAFLAAELGAISADHLECSSDSGLKALAEAGVVAVILPFASMYTRQPFAQAQKMLSSGLQVAVATDFNPGSAPSYHLPFAMALACQMNGLTPAEALKGATINAAKAIGLTATHGSLEVGKCADIAIMNSSGIDMWLYHLEANSCFCTIKNGKELETK
jgi:imidazolonepropionase